MATEAKENNNRKTIRLERESIQQVQQAGQEGELKRQMKEEAVRNENENSRLQES